MAKKVVDLPKKTKWVLFKTQSVIYRNPLGFLKPSMSLEQRL